MVLFFEFEVICFVGVVVVGVIGEYDEVGVVEGVVVDGLFVEEFGGDC